MPTPVFMVCAESMVEDRTTGLCSLFNIIQKLIFSATPKNVMPKRCDLAVVAEWAPEHGDEGAVMECEFAMISPVKHTRIVLAKTEMSFPAGKSYFRAHLKMQGLPPPDGSGVLKFENAIRRKGESEWRTQSYPLIVEIAIPDPATSASKAAATP